MRALSSRGLILLEPRRGFFPLPPHHSLFFYPTCLFHPIWSPSVQAWYSFAHPSASFAHSSHLLPKHRGFLPKLWLYLPSMGILMPIGFVHPGAFFAHLGFLPSWGTLSCILPRRYTAQTGSSVHSETCFAPPAPFSCHTKASSIHPWASSV